MTITAFLIEIFRCLNAQIAVFYAWNTVHAVISVKTSPTNAKYDHSSILTKNDRNFSLFWDSSTFKRSFHSLSHAKCSARYIQRRNKPTFSKNAMIHQILTQNDHNCLPDRDVSLLKRTNCCILRVERGACRNKRQDKPNKP
jgi:hypothetical protein